ncbi:Protein kinase protein rad53 [Neofusicoccum ribis]|uniref:Protein kinase protein rad53 n=1 Tax=Neofusicoccum ribis TaxID=45134 RepID=A0ABR3SGP0_9PEZI
MDDEPTQPSTQQVIDPRRLGRSESGLDEADISDILCILTPTSPAAFQIVKNTAERAPQHVLRSQPANGFLPNSQPFSQSLEEAETFVLDRTGDAHDLALRFSSPTKQLWRQFCFGRNSSMCDVLLLVGPDSAKRMSNLHFRIYVNDNGVLMIEDMSTNGTLVDAVHLKAKTNNPDFPKTQMLYPGSMITLLSPRPEEVIKFIVRIPDRTGYEDEFAQNMNSFLNNVEAAVEVKRQQPGFAVPAVPKTAQSTGRRQPVKSVHTFGMHWNGGREYNVVALLGKGAFATVYQLATAMDGQLLAAKELEKKRFMKNGQMDQKLDNEMKIMQSLSHPHIVQYIDTKDHNSHLYIIMEYLPFGNLSEWLTKNHILPEGAVQRMACQIFSALAYLHSKRITHRDIKPDNILIASEEPFDVKLSDFGLSKVVSNNETFLKTFCGTLLYCAPEVFPHYDGHGNKKRRKPGESKKSFHSYSQSVDIWSFGAVLWSSLCGSPPFEGIMDNTGRAMFNRIMETSLDPTPLREHGVSELGIDLLMAMLKTDPASRPTELQCLAHPWLSGLAKEIVPDIFQPDLTAIPEEDEEEEEEDESFEAVAEDKFSQLSLNDRKAGWGLPDFTDDSQDELGEDLDAINPHQSKRPRVHRDQLFPRYQPRDKSQLESSPEESQNPVLRPRNGVDSFALRLEARGKSRLFGEIGQPPLNSPRTLDNKTNQALMEEDSSGPEIPDKSPKANQSIKRRSKTPVESQTTPRKDPRGNKAAASLYGAESMVRDLTMHSPTSPGSPYDQTSEPWTPSTPNRSIPETPSLTEIGKNGVNKSISQHSDEPTPKAPASAFSRQINLPVSASFFFDPYNKSTHSIEHASKISGIDFISGRSVMAAELTSMPSTHFPSDASEDDADEEDNDGGEEITGGAVHSPPVIDSGFRVPARRLGKLTTTDDSFLKLVLRLQDAVESWGRSPTNTLPYHDVNDTRIPKSAFTLWFYAPGIDDMIKDDKDWTSMPDLHVCISTQSSKGIFINDTRLGPRQPDGRYPFGRLYTADVITVFHQGNKKSLRFSCEFSVGESAKRRPEGLGFQVLHTQPLP